METLKSLASGWSGGLPGTGRPSASFTSDGGQLFAQEVERADEQQQGTVSEQRRRIELESARRTNRRAGFGAERPEAPSATPRSDEADPLALEVPPGGPRPNEQLPRSPETAPEPQVSPGTPSSSSTAAVSGAAPEPVTASTLPSTSPMPVAAPVASLVKGLEVAPVAAASAAPESPVLPPTSLRSTSAKPAPAPAEVAPESAANPAARAEEIVRQIELHLAPGVKRLTLELAPAELGRLSIQLALRAGKISAIVRGERPETLALLQGRAEELTRLFAERGIAADEVRFELGFRAPVSERRSVRAWRAPTPVPGPAGRAAGPDSVDTYA